MRCLLPSIVFTTHDQLAVPSDVLSTNGGNRKATATVAITLRPPSVAWHCQTGPPNSLPIGARHHLPPLLHTGSLGQSGAQ